MNVNEDLVEINQAESPGKQLDKSNENHCFEDNLNNNLENSLQASLQSLKLSDTHSNSASNLERLRKHTDETNQLLDFDHSHASNVEFATKLGYTKEIISIAFSRLGPHAEQNELLEELVKLNKAQNNHDGSQENAYCNTETSDPVIVQTTNSKRNSNATSLHSNLKPIIIDGSNVAMSHGKQKIFSCKGIKICVDWFRNRGHREITAFVPKWRKESSGTNMIADKEILNELEREHVLIFTPSRIIGGKRMVCYDDRYILKLAYETDGVVVSNDSYRDLILENAEFKKVAQECILMYSFVNDIFMPPDDPLGRSGPSLDVFLRVQIRNEDCLQLCPYGRKCTYGNKCKYFHSKQMFCSAKKQIFETAAAELCETAPRTAKKSLSAPLSTNRQYLAKRALCRTKSNDVEINVSKRSHSPSPFAAHGDVTGHRSTGDTPRLVLTDEQSKEHALPNHHKKLQRQFPTAVNYFNLNKSQTSAYKPATSPLDNIEERKPLHRPLSSALSAPMAQLMPRQDHQNLSRISSSPGTMNLMQLNDSGNLAGSSASNMLWGTGLKELILNQKTFNDKRRVLYHYLSEFFPKDKVDYAFQMYRNELDPGKLYFAIYNLNLTNFK